MLTCFDQLGPEHHLPWYLYQAVIMKEFPTGFSLTPYLESFTPTFGLGTPVFPRISSNLHCGTPTFSKRCLWDSYFQNPSENPALNAYNLLGKVV